MVYGVDKCTYAANRDLLKEFNQYSNFTFLEKDIKDLDHLYDCDYVINTAAESHVGNSIIQSDTSVFYEQQHNWSKKSTRFNTT